MGREVMDGTVGREVMDGTVGREVEFRDLGVVSYGECWRLQQELFEALIDSKRSGEPLTVGHILMVEHPAVYTLGKSGKSDNVLFSEQQLEAIGAEYFHIDRGGDVTFHGPGQIVLYPILDLEGVGIGLKQYIWALEQAVIETVAHWGVEAQRCEGAAGVWITDGGRPSPGGGRPSQSNNEGAKRNKICAIGVKSSRYVTMHGLAMNVETDLKYFNYINPCGFTDRGVTSLECEVGCHVSIEEVKELLLNNLIKILNVKIYKK